MSYDRHLDQSAEQALSSVRQVAEEWGAMWEPEGSTGILRLPVSHGLRQSLLEGPLTVEADPRGSGSTLRFRVEATRTKVNWTASLLLLIGAAGGIVTMLWPFFPGLLPLAPAGIVLAIAAWLLVASRLRTTEIEDFFDLVDQLGSD
ncbi:MAG: hypothetical protein P8Y44_05445 [Acidobacteriota bacterium]